jgi:hypothetical protein
MRLWSDTRIGLACVLLGCAGLLPPKTLSAEPIAVRHAEGLMHGYLVLQTMEGQTIADGEETQTTRGDRVTVHLVFHFRDGSIQEETTIFSQRGTFRLIRDRLIQKGPSFKQPMDTVVDTSTRQVTVRYSDKDGKEKIVTEELDLQPDLANGLVLTLLKDIQPNVPQTTVSMVAATPKPRLIKLEIRPQGEDLFSVGSIHKKATHYVVKVQIGGVAGVIAPIVGKQPPDTHIWVLGGVAPAFVKLEGALFEGGPIWRIKMANAAVFKAAPAKPQAPPAGQTTKSSAAFQPQAKVVE